MPRSARRKNRVARRRLALVFALIFAPAAARTTRAACVEFALEVTIGTSFASVSAVAAADLDADGDFDAVSAFSGAGEIHWHENDGGAGGWTRHTIATGATFVPSIATGDVDRDGDIDVLAASSNLGRFDWYENDGAGGGWSRHTIGDDDGAAGARAIFAADLDRDGDADALTAAAATDRVAWYENDGTGGGWTLRTISTVAEFGTSVLAADLDGDGDLDVASSSYDDAKIAWYESDGTPLDGGWTLHTISTEASGASSTFVADLDGDGDLDLLSTSHGDGEIAWYENDGTPGDGGWIRITISDSAPGAYSVRAEDVDGDGDPDALSASFGGDDIAWHENDGEGGGWTVHSIAGIAIGARDVTAADLDGDGDADVLSASYGNDTVEWYRNDLLHGESLFAVSPTVATLASNLSSLSAVDLDRDGDLDGLSSSFSGDRIEWYENAAVGGDASSWTRHLVVDTADGAASAEAADIDGDGDPDILAANYINGFWWYANTAGDASVWSAVAIHSGALPANDIVAADLDRDGDLDAVSAWGGAHTVAWHQNTDAEGDGSIWSEHVVATNVGYALLVAVADLNRDGDLDVLAADNSVDTIIWFANDGTPAAGPWTSLSIASVLDPRAMATADIDGDGDLDVLSASNNDDTIAWHENDGTPLVDPQTSWTARPISTVANGASWVTAADADGDGDLDVIAGASSLTAAAHWYENDGSPATGPWTFHSISTTMAGCYAAIPADLDGDGDLDVLGAGNAASALRWFPNPGTKVFDDGYDSDANTACWSSVAP